MAAKGKPRRGVIEMRGRRRGADRAHRRPLHLRQVRRGLPRHGKPPRRTASATTAAAPSSSAAPTTTPRTVPARLAPTTPDRAADRLLRQGQAQEVDGMATIDRGEPGRSSCARRLSPPSSGTTGCSIPRRISERPLFTWGSRMLPGLVAGKEGIVGRGPAAGHKPARSKDRGAHSRREHPDQQAGADRADLHPRHRPHQGAGDHGRSASPRARRVNELTDDEVLASARSSTATTGRGRPAREIAMNIKRLMDLGCYRGLRHRRGLPVRGQRTHTNARTRKGRPGRSPARRSTK